MIKNNLLLVVLISVCCSSMANSTGWKAAAASIIITPKEYIWMGGFAFRNHPADGKYSDLRAKAIALEDEEGKRVVMISLDLSAINKSFSDKVRDRLNRLFNLPKERILLNCTHTHSGPEVVTGYIKDSVGKRKVEEYARQLELQVVELVAKVLKSLQPAIISSENGVSRFQVNRRNNTESELPIRTDYKGPNDFSVSVFKITKADGQLMAVVFGYACHNSVLREYKWSADYSGYAEEMLEWNYPGSTALFFQGAGGDQIAYPRGSNGSAKQHGYELAAAVERVISEKMEILKPNLITSYAEIPLEVNVENGITRNYPYPLQVWKIGQQVLITMGGEPLVEYALQFKRMFGQNIFVYGYSNDVMAYISTAAVLNEGGYEGSSAPFKKGRWSTNIESSIINQVAQMARRTGVPLLPNDK